MIIEIEFPLRGREIPVDHGYALAGALKSEGYLTADDLRSIRVAPIIGDRSLNPNRILINSGSRLRFRAHEITAKKILKVAGKSLDLRGHIITIKAPRLWGLAAVESLRSKIVVIKNAATAEDFQFKIREHLGSMGSSAEITVGRRKTISVKGAPQIGREVRLDNLEPEISLSVMANGIGGRTSFGAGWFDPV